MKQAMVSVRFVRSAFHPTNSCSTKSLGTFAFDPSATSKMLRRESLLTYAAPDTATLKKGQLYP